MTALNNRLKADDEKDANKALIWFGIFITCGMTLAALAALYCAEKL